MTSTSDAVLQTIPGIMSVGVMANVAGQAMRPYGGGYRSKKRKRRGKTVSFL